MPLNKTCFPAKKLLVETAKDLLMSEYDVSPEWLLNKASDSLAVSYIASVENHSFPAEDCSIEHYKSFIKRFIDVEALIRYIIEENNISAYESLVNDYKETLGKIEKFLRSGDTAAVLSMINIKLASLKS